VYQLPTNLNKFQHIWYLNLAMNAWQCGVQVVHFTSRMYAHYLVNWWGTKVWQR